MKVSDIEHNHVIINYFVFSSLRFIYSFERDRERGKVGGRVAAGEGGKEFRTDSSISAEPDVELDPTTLRP